MTLDRAPEDTLREEQENDGPVGYVVDPTEEGEPRCRCNTESHDPNCHIDHTLSALEARIAFPGASFAGFAGLGLPHYSEEAYGLKGILNYSYWNANGIGMVILAIEGGAADWAAYIGGQPSRGLSEEDTVRWTARKGCKLSRDQAHRWFPQLPIEAYRE